MAVPSAAIDVDESETLDAIGLRHGTDKASDRNKYLSFYAQFLEPIRYQPVRVMEIGVLGGASIRMWRDYFPNGSVIGVDIDPQARRHAGERITIEIANQSDERDLMRIAALGPFDLVIDDGSHVWAHQIATFQRLVQSLAPGGFYVLEDLDTSYGDYVRHFRGRGGISAAAYLHEASSLLLGSRVLDLSKPNHQHLSPLISLIEFIAFSRGTSVIRRRVTL